MARAAHRSTRSDRDRPRAPKNRKQETRKSKVNFWTTPVPMGIKKPISEGSPCFALSKSERKLNAKACLNDPYAPHVDMNKMGAVTGRASLVFEVTADIDLFYERQERLEARNERRRRKYQAQMNKLAHKISNITIAEPKSELDSEELQYPMSDEEWAAHCASSESESTSDCASSSDSSSGSDYSTPSTPREGSVEPSVSVAVQAINDLHVATPEERLVQDLNDSIMSMDLAPKRKSPPLPSRNRKARQASKPYDAKMRRHARVAEARLPDDTPLPTAGDIAAATAHLRSAIKRAKSATHIAEDASYNLVAMAGMAYTRLYGAPPSNKDDLPEALAPEQVVRKARWLQAQAELAKEHAGNLLSRYCLACQYAGVPVSAELMDSAEASIAL
ncbi:uncharacterized protein SCHCODRAFT_02613007 [Schizophyllum commune H4-8]|uniref:Uncharacterized protein n=1 Tax=Schizophyllum commune (strain H4-8 / FGSC 9210) TaxID=578458 RepID=D8PMQ8_SCHCM|nr:uncharacterized protein SCHCODRAFT_02613007 [Schizophyllum commune H4-8]KAI5898733.1 hypothetical protein SCHCODRAFT_02613007 [Schizophyllum commune H4-8]